MKLVQIFQWYLCFSDHHIQCCTTFLWCLHCFPSRCSEPPGRKGWMGKTNVLAHCQWGNLAGLSLFCTFASLRLICLSACHDAWHLVHTHSSDWKETAYNFNELISQWGKKKKKKGNINKAAMVGKLYTFSVSSAFLSCSLSNPSLHGVYDLQSLKCMVLLISL